MLARGAKDKEHTMSQKLNTAIAVAGIDIGKNSFHVIGLDKRGAIVLRQKWSRGQVDLRPASATSTASSKLRKVFASGLSLASQSQSVFDRFASVNGMVWPC